MGTFKICPRIFNQFFTINAFVHGRQFPHLYALLPAKTRAVYNRMFTLFKESLQASGLQIINSQQITCDYELALIQATEMMHEYKIILITFNVFGSMVTSDYRCGTIFHMLVHACTNSHLEGWHNRSRKLQENHTRIFRN